MSMPKTIRTERVAKYIDKLNEKFNWLWEYQERTGQKSEAMQIEMDAIQWCMRQAEKELLGMKE